MNLDFTPGDFLTDFLLQQIALQRPEHRVLLYRALAAETTDKQLRKECRQRAREIEEFMRHEEQMLLHFREQRKSPRNGGAE